MRKYEYLRPESLVPCDFFSFCLSLPNSTPFPRPSLSFTLFCPFFYLFTLLYHSTTNQRPSKPQQKKSTSSNTTPPSPAYPPPPPPSSPPPTIHPSTSPP